MASVIFSDVLCIVHNNLRRLNKETLLETVAKFYHDDELCTAKRELCKYVSAMQAANESDPAAPVVEGWAKFINNKGVPTIRKASEPAMKRRHEPEDLLQMMIMLDVQKIELPTIAIVDLDRVPGTVLVHDLNEVLAQMKIAQ